MAANAEHLKALVRAHAEANDDLFYGVALQVAGWCPAKWCNSDLRIAPGHGAAIAQLSE
jgi:hypothetical protein